MIRIVALHSTGDVYMISALVESFRRTHNRDVELIIKKQYACIAEMFGVPFSCDNALIEAAEHNPTMQRDYDNVIADDRLFYCHPSFLRTNVRVDHLTQKPDASQVDMYKILLRIPPDAPISLPTIPTAEMQPGKVIVISEAKSWPNTEPDFWPLLIGALMTNGWYVFDNKKTGWDLRELFEQCASAEWVIGPQCGVLMILTHAQFPCRKTFATPTTRFRYGAGTFPYGYVTKFANEDYDVEEFVIAPNTHGALVDAIINGSNALRLWRHDPRPTLCVNVPLTPGDFLDRLAVLTVKRGRFSIARRAAIEREFQRHNELRGQAGFSAEVNALFEELVTLHAATFDLLENMVPAALGDSLSSNDHVEAVKLNKRRIELKRAIDATCRAPYSEVKSYHGD